MQILDGKLASAAILESLKNAILSSSTPNGRTPHLCAIIAGNNPASESYLNSKIKGCAATGITSSIIRLDADISENEFIQQIEKVNNDQSIDGLLIQFPLPAHFNESKIINAINPSKDVDGLHPVNAGKLALGLPTFVPATPLGIMLLLEYFKIETTGKHAVVIGRSNVIGRPISILLSRNEPFGNATVTVCHSRTSNIKDLCLSADLVVAALGKPGFLTADMIKEGSVIIDVGINSVPDSSKKSGFAIKGDVDFESVAPKCKSISPVPGGVGLMTIAAILQNTLLAYQNKFKFKS